MLSVYLLLFAIAAVIGTSAQEYRLQKVVLPDSYDIAIKPYLRDDDGAKQFTFDGDVNITLHTLTEDVRSISVHKDYLDILETALYDVNDQLVERLVSTQLIYDTVTDVLTTNLTAPLQAHLQYKLYFKYTGQIRDGLAGVFRGSYSNTSWYAVTQLQRIDARTAFPCFDEPEFKAKFRLRISRPKEFSSYFNTRLLSTVVDGDHRYVDTFEESPPMSTYLVAFLIGEFVEQGDSEFKLIMHSKFTNNTAYAYEVGRKTLEAYDNYTGIPYKTLGNAIMQMAGLGRFPHNGMENWGLVMYRDSVLEHEPGYTDGWSNKEYTVTILVHETAHMWFGNSVTFKWWSYFWLNEAFARYYQYFLADEIYPEFELAKQFIVNQIHLIFGTDATNGTQPMTSREESIQTPSQIAYKFSGIAYAKGASIVRMVCNLMGKENFDNAIREYLSENHLGNTEPDDLFVHWRRHWPTEQNVDLNQFLSDWTEQVGFPMLLIGLTASGQYSLKQQRFLLDAADGSDASLTYTIPITFTTDREINFDDLTPKFYLNKTVAEMDFGDANADDWIVFNLQQSNYHRVFYETPLLKRIHKAFMASNHSGIHTINRAHIVDDLFTYGRIGLMGYNEVFSFMEYLASETEYLPWHPAFSGLQLIHQRLTLAQHKDFGYFLFEIMASVYKKLGFGQANDTVLDVYHRNYVISWLCKYHHSKCNSEAQQIFRTSLQSNTKPSPDFRETLYCAACRDATFDIYYALSELYNVEMLASEREKLLRAMGCTKNFVEYHYAFILSSNVSQDLKATAISSMYTQTPENVTPVYRSITETAEYLAKVLESWAATASVIGNIAGYFTTQDQLEMLKQFIDSKGHLFGPSVSTLENAVRTVEKNLEWSGKHLDKLFTYLDISHIGDDCQVTPVIHVLQYPGCVPKPIPSFACVGRCASYIQVSGSKIWQMERSCMCCQESGEREAAVSLFCPKAKHGERKFKKVLTKAPLECMCRPCTSIEESGIVPQEIAGYSDEGPLNNHFRRIALQ